MTGSMAKPGRLGIGIIGAGKVGAVLGAALRGAEHAVVGVSAVSDASRERAETLLPGVPVLDVQDIVERAELVLLAVPDDALGPLVDGLAKLGAWQPGQLVAHTSGRFGVGILHPVRAAGAVPLALHPAMTFTGMSLDLTRLLDCTFGVTADAAMLPIAQALVVEMGAEPVAIAEADRTLYHAALAHGSNHLVTLVAQASQLLREVGVEAPERMLGPLLRATLENALASGESALTGPVARGDVGTVAAHAEALREHDGGSGGDILEAYLAMARATARRAGRRGLLKPDQLDGITAGARGPGPRRPATLRKVPDLAIQLVTTAAQLRAESARLLTEKGGTSQGLVPTMGALHEGHAELARTAVEQNDVVVASIFVNPLQFGEAVDLERYPRTLEADLALLDAEGVDLVFAPDVDEVYPGGEPRVRISAGPMAEKWEGASRPGHFDGALTVVAKLLHYGMPGAAAGPELPAYRAYFGQKDAQQLALVQRMVADLNFPVEIVPVPIVRSAGRTGAVQPQPLPLRRGTRGCAGALAGAAAHRGTGQRPPAAGPGVRARRWWSPSRSWNWTTSTWWIPAPWNRSRRTAGTHRSAARAWLSSRPRWARSA